MQIINVGHSLLAKQCKKTALAYKICVDIKTDLWEGNVFIWNNKKSRRSKFKSGMLSRKLSILLD